MLNSGLDKVIKKRVIKYQKSIKKAQDINPALLK